MKKRPWDTNTSNAAVVDVDEATYFAEYDGYMTAHKTADFRESPALFRAKYIDKTIVEPERPAYAFGSAAHCLILEGEKKFDERFVVSDGPKNPRTGECYGRTTKAFGDWLDEMRSANVEPITKAEFEQIQQMRQSINDHVDASALFQKGVAEQTVRAELVDVPCQSRLDWLTSVDDFHTVVDLKTCQSIRKFERDFVFFGYARQMAFYAEMLRQWTNTKPSVYVVAVEKSPPFACGVWFVTPSTIDTATDEILATLVEYRRCVKSNVWPTRFETLRQF